MNTKGLLCAGLVAGLPLAAFGYDHVGIGLNFGVPVYDYPPSRVVVVHQPYATEAVPPSPGPDFVWIGGRWEWDTPSNRWVWYAGSWQKPPTPVSTWRAGYWAQQGGHYLWIGSHWDSPPGAVAVATPPMPPPPMPPVAQPTAPAPATTAAQPAADSATPPQEIMVNQAPPPPIGEEPAAAPGPDYTWISGVWTWNGAWIWAPGHYVHPPHPGAVWEMGSWKQRGASWVWETGHWR